MCSDSLFRAVTQFIIPKPSVSFGFVGALSGRTFCSSARSSTEGYNFASEPESSARKSPPTKQADRSHGVASYHPNLTEGFGIIYVDGSALGNPGPAGIGVVICDSSNKIINQIQRSLSSTTNNIAEYEALICGLEAALIHKVSQVIVRSDSELIVRQSMGRYKVRARHLKPLAEQVKRLVSGFDRVIFQRIPREENRQADRLARLASSCSKSRRKDEYTD